MYIAKVINPLSYLDILVGGGGVIEPKGLQNY